MVRETRLESESKSRECFEQLPWHGCRQGHTRGDSVLPVNRDEVASPWDSSKPQPPTTTRARPDPISAMTGLQHGDSESIKTYKNVFLSELCSDSRGITHLL